MERRHAIIIIKNDKEEYLQYFDKRWNSYLFLNCKIDNERDTKKIKNEIEQKLNINNIEISYKFDKIHTKFSESDKIEKEYHHYFYEAKIKDFSDIIFNKEFEINDIKFKWYSYNEFLKDKRIQEINFDIVEFIKEIK